jgi:BA14K-like protein
MQVPHPLVLILALLLATPAHADRPAYCAAYARDFADVHGKDKTMWQHKYDIAFQACMGQATPQVTKPPSKPMVARIPESAKKIIKQKKLETAVVAPELPKQTLKLKPGSEDWNTYCANKYTSFNPKTGNYLSKTGVERKCVVSPN